MPESWIFIAIFFGFPSGEMDKCPAACLACYRAAFLNEAVSIIFHIFPLCCKR